MPDTRIASSDTMAEAYANSIESISSSMGEAETGRNYNAILITTTTGFPCVSSASPVHDKYSNSVTQISAHLAIETDRIRNTDRLFSGLDQDIAVQIALHC